MRPKKEDFWGRYQELRKKEIQVHSHVYEWLDSYWFNQRRKFSDRWQMWGDLRLPPETLGFYQEVFGTIYEKLHGILLSSSETKRFLSFLKKAYLSPSVKLSTLDSLLRTDVFAEKTCHMDLDPRVLLRGLRSERSRPEFITKSYHYALHRPQRTEHIFLHELIVGYLGHLILNGGVRIRKGDLPIFSDNYWLLPAYSARLMMKVLDMGEAEMIGLHLADSAYVNSRVPREVRDVLLTASHLYWVLEWHCLATGKKKAPAVILGMLFSFYLIPTFESLLLNGTRLDRKPLNEFLGDGLKRITRGSNQASGRELNDSDLIIELSEISRKQWKNRA